MRPIVHRVTGKLALAETNAPMASNQVLPILHIRNARRYLAKTVEGALLRLPYGKQATRLYFGAPNADNGL